MNITRQLRVFITKVMSEPILSEYLSFNTDALIEMMCSNKFVIICQLGMWNLDQNTHKHHFYPYPAYRQNQT